MPRFLVDIQLFHLPLFSTPFTFNIFSEISTGQKSSTATEAVASNDDERQRRGLFSQNSQSLDNLQVQGYEYEQRVPNTPPPSYSTLQHTTTFRRHLQNDSSTTSNSSTTSGTSSTSSYDFEDYFPNNDGLRVQEQHDEIDTRAGGATQQHPVVDGKETECVNDLLVGWLVWHEMKSFQKFTFNRNNFSNYYRVFR